jgi:hypothetical protein
MPFSPIKAQPSDHYSYSSMIPTPDAQVIGRLYGLGQGIDTTRLPGQLSYRGDCPTRNFGEPDQTISAGRSIDADRICAWRSKIVGRSIIPPPPHTHTRTHPALTHITNHTHKPIGTT